MTTLFIYPMILGLFIMIGVIGTKEPIGDAVGYIMATLYMIPLFIVVLVVSVVTTPIYWIRKACSK